MKQYSVDLLDIMLMLMIIFEIGVIAGMLIQTARTGCL